MSSNVTTLAATQAATPFQMDNPVFDSGQFANMMQVAEIMATAKLVPEHLQKSPGDCLLVVEQARRWNMSPFAVAQETYSIRGKLLFGGKLVTAVINSRAPVKAPLRFTFEGAADNREITAAATFKGEDEPRVYTIKIAQAKAVAGNSTLWKTDPDQQACYFAARFWARRHCPEVLLGVWSEDEIDAAQPMRDITPATEATLEIADPYGEVALLPAAEAVARLREMIKAATPDELAVLYEMNQEHIDREPSLTLAMSDASTTPPRSPQDERRPDDTAQDENRASEPPSDDDGHDTGRVEVVSLDNKRKSVTLDAAVKWLKAKADDADLPVEDYADLCKFNSAWIERLPAEQQDAITWARS